MDRRLAAILSADVVGYSRLMAADETGTLSRLNAERRDRLEPLIKAHRGRIFKLTGDGILVEFASVVDAVTCAAEWQAGSDGDLLFRIGINLGEVIVQDGDVYGTGVNIAARLEGKAQPGGICVSAAIHDQVLGKVDLPFQDFGPQTLRNIDTPVHAYRIAPPDGMHVPTDQGQGHDVKLRVAVLPLKNMSPDPAQDAFSDGLTQDIITALSRSYALEVAAQSSTSAYKGQSPDIRTIAAALGVSYVLEGSVRQGTDRARITVQLIEAASGTHVWADRYDRAMDDEFAVQDEIAQRVSSILQERIWQDVARNIGQKDASEYTFYDLTYRGIELLHRLNPADTALAETYFQAALDIDDTAYFGHLGMGFSHAAYLFWSDPDDQHLAKAHQHGQRLVEIAPDSAQTWRLLSRTNWGMGRYRESWSCVERALRLDPNDGDIIGCRGIYHVFDGQPSEAIEWLNRVLVLHADTPHSADIMHYWKAMALFSARDYSTAADMVRRVSGHDFIRAGLLAACHARLNQFEDARAQADAVMQANPTLRLGDMRLWKSFRDKAQRHDLRDALRKAGIPD